MMLCRPYDGGVPLAVIATDLLLIPQAQALATRLGLNLAPEAAELLLVLTPERLELREANSRTGPVLVDFSAQRAVSRRSGPRLEVARAVGVKRGHRPTVLDATAGLGQDAFALAAIGCRVTMIERHPVVAALLADGLARAQRDPELAMVAARLQLIVGDALELMHQPATPRPEAVLLDPMYPHRSKQALPKKELRLFRRLVGDDLDADALLDAALALATRRVAVKRPRHAPPLAGRQPGAVILGKTTRFDLYLV